MQFYTYMWLREDGTPYYIGKTNSLRRTRGQRHSVNPPSVDRIIVQEWPSEDSSLFAERFLIVYYGRKDIGTGILHNHTDGGEGCHGFKQSPETVEKRVSKTRGKKRTEKQRQNIREGKTGSINPSHTRSGEHHWNRGLVRSEETREKIRKSRLAQDMSSRIKKFCKRGHERIPENLGTNSTCKACKKLLNHLWYKAKRSS